MRRAAGAVPAASTGLLERLAVVLLLLLGVTVPAAAWARESMELSAHPVRIEYDASDSRVAKRVAEICEEEIPTLCAQLGITRMLPIDVDVVRDVSPYRNRLGPELPRWGVAFAMMNQQKMVVDVPRATRAFNSLERVIPHELSHLLVAQRVGNVPLPLWFLEGLAKWQAGEWSLLDSWQLMNTVWGSKTPNLWRLTERYPPGDDQARAAYRVSYAAFTYRFGERFDELPRFLDTVAKIGDFDKAFEVYWREAPVVFYGRFQKDLERKYHSRLLVFQPAPLFGIMSVLFLLVIFRYIYWKRRKLRKLERLDGGLSLDDD